MNQITPEDIGATESDGFDNRAKIITWDDRHAPITTTRTVICLKIKLIFETHELY